MTDDNTTKELNRIVYQLGKLYEEFSLDTGNKTIEAYLLNYAEAHDRLVWLMADAFTLVNQGKIKPPNNP